MVRSWAQRRGPRRWHDQSSAELYQRSMVRSNSPLLLPMWSLRLSLAKVHEPSGFWTTATSHEPRSSRFLAVNENAIFVVLFEGLKRKEIYKVDRFILGMSQVSIQDMK